MAIDLMGSNTYFGTHSKFKVWNGGEYSKEQKDGAIDQAKRDLSREFGRPMREDEPPYRYGDRARDEFAVYEQALHILRLGGVAFGKSSAVPPLDAGETVPELAGNEMISPAAMRWLGQGLGVRMVRG